MLAFRKALGAGADGIECDLQKSADGAYLIIHDPTTGRTSGEPLEVRKTSLEDLRRLECGSGQRIPLLEELLQGLPAEAYIDLELKEETLRPADSVRIASILEAYHRSERLMVSSFDPNLLIPFRKQGFTVGLLIGEASVRRGILGLAKVLLRLRPQFLNLPEEIVAILGARRAILLMVLLRCLGFSLLLWTVNLGSQAVFFAPHGRIIVTDEVEQIVKALRPRWKKTTDS
jgi:glycerophosphoryl diester phosphodiesterase